MSDDVHIPHNKMIGETFICLCDHKTTKREEVSTSLGRVTCPTCIKKEAIRLRELVDRIHVDTRRPRIEPAGSVPNADTLNSPVARLRLSIRGVSTLRRLQVGTIGELMEITEDTLERCRGFGDRSMNELKQALAEYGLKLKLGRDEDE